jgi:hypothetical protein
MAKKIENAVLDQSLDYVSGNSETMYILSGEPANYAAIAGLTLASVAVAGGDFTKSDGDTSGRKIDVAAKSGVTISSSGTATHVCLAKDSATSELLVTTTCASTTLTSPGTVDIGTWKYESSDPA